MILINNEISFYNKSNESREIQQTVRWFLDNLLHRDNNHPAYIGRGYKEQWEYGKQVFIFKDTYRLEV